jgi:hypothetical protein
MEHALTPEDRDELLAARRILETPSLAAKATHLLGTPIEKGIARLPANWREGIAAASQSALSAALRASVTTLKGAPVDASPGWHKAAVALSGATGGAFGLAGLTVELPVSTLIICRSIADIARANGECLDDPAARLACLEVFALGGTSAKDDAVDTGYFAVRAALAKAVSDAAQYIAAHGLADRAAPALVRLVTQVAARFQVQVTQKVAAQAVPVIGAASGALINLMFIDHFQTMSRAHFTVRRLERRYGEAAVRSAYSELPALPRN